MADQNEPTAAGKNCANCKKILRKVKRYYREGAYYCNKNCYKKKVLGGSAQPAE